MIHNPILESVMQIKKLDLVHEWVQCYGQSQVLLGSQFEEKMSEIDKEITDLALKGNEKCTWWAAALLILWTPMEEWEEGMDVHIKACIAWKGFRIWEQLYG